jgi:hypothetical protein
VFILWRLLQLTDSVIEFNPDKFRKPVRVYHYSHFEMPYSTGLSNFFSALQEISQSCRRKWTPCRRCARLAEFLASLQERKPSCRKLTRLSAGFRFFLSWELTSFKWQGRFNIRKSLLILATETKPNLFSGYIAS